MDAWTASGTRVTVADDFRLPGGFSTKSDEETPPADPNEPPRGGLGSGVVQWQDHLDTYGVDRPDEATRDELIALWDDRG